MHCNKQTVKPSLLSPGQTGARAVYSRATGTLQEHGTLTSRTRFTLYSLGVVAQRRLWQQRITANCPPFVLVRADPSVPFGLLASHNWGAVLASVALQRRRVALRCLWCTPSVATASRLLCNALRGSNPLITAHRAQLMPTYKQLTPTDANNNWCQLKQPRVNDVTCSPAIASSTLC